MENKTITIRSVYKVKQYYIQPLKQKNGMNHPFVKKVRINPNGESEMILSEKEMNDPESQYFIPEDMEIFIEDGTTFNLADPLQRNKWLAIQDSELIVPTRGAKDEHGNLIIDGDKRRYGLAELYVDVPGEESEKSVNKRKLITKAWTYIENDSAAGRLTKVKLLGKVMRNAPESDIADYLYQKAEAKPELVIDLYTSPDSVLKLLLIDAREKNVIRKINQLFMYGDTVLGATDEAMILFLKTPSNKRVLEAIKNETYPDFVRTVNSNLDGQQDPNDENPGLALTNEDPIPEISEVDKQLNKGKNNK